MRENRWKHRLGAVGGMLLTYALMSSPAAWAGQDQTAKGKAPAVKAQSADAKTEGSKDAVAEKTPSGDGSHESIKVHGHWTIEVHDPDGTLVSHREFENSLATGRGLFTGDGVLAGILGRQLAPGFWNIALVGSICSSSPNCELAEAADPVSASQVFHTLTVKAPTTGANTSQFVLSGVATAQLAGNIVQVATGLGLQVCAGTTTPAPATCTNSNNGASFSGTGLLTPVQVAAGQIVQVTVVISFS